MMQKLTCGASTIYINLFCATFCSFYLNYYNQRQVNQSNHSHSLRHCTGELALFFFLFFFLLPFICDLHFLDQILIRYNNSSVFDSKKQPFETKNLQTSNKPWPKYREPRANVGTLGTQQEEK